MKRSRYVGYSFVAIWCVLGLMMGAFPLYAQAGGMYTVQAGDTLFGVARRYGVSVEGLAQANGLVWTAWLVVGQRLVIPGLVTAPPASSPPPDGDLYIVRPGDTLTIIAIRKGVDSGELAALNGLRWNAWVFVGQCLQIPGYTMESESPLNEVLPMVTPDIMPTMDGVYIVQLGNTLFSIARVHDTTVAALRATNGLVSNIIYVGQELVIPNDDVVPAPVPPPQHGLHGEKWIDVNLTTQTLTAYEGQVPVYSVLVSTGLGATPTVVGDYKIYAKYAAVTMSGVGYNLPNVPWIMYFHRGYGIHGAYWHTNFGAPMSHGCVNMAPTEAQWIYNWAPMGTKVVTHH